MCVEGAVLLALLSYSREEETNCVRAKCEFVQDEEKPVDVEM